MSLSVCHPRECNVTDFERKPNQPMPEPYPVANSTMRTHDDSALSRSGDAGFAEASCPGRLS
jgi:hypothetical protein